MDAASNKPDLYLKLRVANNLIPKPNRHEITRARGNGLQDLYKDAKSPLSSSDRLQLDKHSFAAASSAWVNQNQETMNSQLATCSDPSKHYSCKRGKAMQGLLGAAQAYMEFSGPRVSAILKR